MSSPASKTGVHDVKSKVASYEAHNENIRTNDSPERLSSTGSMKSPASVASGSMHSRHFNRQFDSNDGGDDDLPQKQSTTQLASQNRRSRLQRARQTQPEPGSLMQRRLTAKERRKASLQQHPTLQQQKKEQQRVEQREQSAQRSDYPATRHENTQPPSPGKQLTSPSSLSQSRSPARRPASDPTGRPANVSQSPKMMAAALQHRASNYANNRSPQHQEQQQQQQHQQQQQQNQDILKNDSIGSSTNQYSYRTSNQSPKMMAAALQHKASNYANNRSPLQQQQQQQQQQHQLRKQEEEHRHHLLQQQQQKQDIYKNDPIGSSTNQDSSRTSNGGSTSVSRFHKLKMKGMDHAKLAQKRKEAAQKQQRKEDPREDHRDVQDAPASPPKVHPQQRSPQHAPDSPPKVHPQQRSPQDAPASPPKVHPQQPSPQRPIPQQQEQEQQQKQPQQPQRQPQPQRYQRNSPLPMQHQTAKSQDSPDHVNNTDDEATLTSVARVLDQEQTFSESKEVPSPQELSQQQQQPSPSGSKIGKPPRLWMGGEEKSDKAQLENNPHHNQGIYPRPSSSSEYEPEINPRKSQNPYSMRGGADSQTPSPQQSQQQAYHHQQQYAPPASYHSSQSPHYASPQAGATMTTHDRVRSEDLMRRSQGSYPSTNGHHLYQSSSARLDDDDRTFDYGVKDDDSQGSTTFQKQLLEADRKAREQSHFSEGNADYMSQSDSGSRRHGRRARGPTTPRKKTDDPAEHYRQSMESPVMKTAAGVMGAATVGCIVAGPVGLFLGVACVGMGVGFMQIPEEQRNNMADKAKVTMSKVEEQAYSASEALSNSCATTYKDSGIADHIPAEMSKFCAVSEDDVDNTNVISPEIKSEDSEAVRLDQVTGACGGGVGDTDLPRLKNQDPRKPISPNQSRSLRSKKVACLRHVRIIPVSQIHGLDPAAQPRAWLDVLASADTSNDEKTEAMEEILILAKDKQRARIFLEEGILDSIMWILSRYFEKLNRRPTDVWANPDISFEERNAAKLAATCCVSLGKAHCAAIHTEGDLLLMSLYERGTVPEERQLAQMLYEVPHHTRVTKTNDPTVVDPSMEVFALRQLTLPQAEELAKSVKALADGR